MPKESHVTCFLKSTSVIDREIIDAIENDWPSPSRLERYAKSCLDNWSQGRTRSRFTDIRNARESLPHRCETLDHLGLLPRRQFLYNCALLYDRIGAGFSAIAIYERALGLCSHLLGQNETTTVSLVVALGETYELNEMMRDAGMMFRRVLVAREQTPGARHYLMAHAACSLSRVYGREHKLMEAEVLLQQVISKGPIENLLLVLEPGDHSAIAICIKI